MSDTTTKAVALAVALLAVVVLIAARVGFEWAGGDGLTAPLVITNGETWGTECAPTSTDTQHIHEITCTGQRKRFTFGAAVITLDENTDVSIVSDDASKPVINLVTGRIVIDGPLSVSIRDVTIATEGITTFVHYSWLNKVDVMVVDGTADIRQGDFSSNVSTGNAVAVDTLPPYDELSPTTFNLDASSAKVFYEWALE